MRRIVFIFIVIFSSLLYAQREKTEADGPNRKLIKPVAQGPDIGYALMTKGELVNCFMNFGGLTDSYFQTDFYNFMWPKSKGIIASGDNAVDDFSFMFGRKGNVIDAFTAYRQEDWSPVPGSWGMYHAKDQPAELKYNDFPHLAVSDIPATWPEGYFDEDGNFIETPGEHHWPGSYRLDINPKSPTYGQEVIGEFAADRVIYAALDDHTNLTNPPLGIRLDIEAYEYGRPYAADFHFYDITITNTSDTYLDSCYWGFYYDIDYGEYEDEAYYTYNSGLNPGPWDVIYELDPEITDPNEPETGVFGVAFLKTPKDLGITDSHYYLDTGPTTDEQLWPIMSSNPNDPNISMTKADYFHGSDVRLDDYTLTQTNFGYDWVCLTSTGPFDLAPGESVKSVVVVCGGDNVEDFMANIEMAKSMMEKNYQGPSGPKPPSLYAVPGDQQVTLYWTDEPERAPDPFSGEYDFEGYKIYRSEDNGQSWGTEILDGSGRLVGYVPVATFDLNNSFSGLDPLNANFNLGSNTGIRHSWVDTDVKNGVNYAYTITAYDHGDPASNIMAFESSKGTKSTEHNFIVVTPEPRALGFVDPLAEYRAISGHAKGYLDIEVIDPFVVTDHIYHIAFVDSPALDFNVIDATTGELKLEAYPINRDEAPVVDGFRVRVNGDETFGGIKAVTDEYGRNVLGSQNPDTTNSWYVEVMSWNRGDFAARTSDYEIRFTANGSNVGTRIGTSIEIKETVPFEVWNTTYNRQVTAIVLDDGDGAYEEGELIYLVNVPYDNPNIGDTYNLDILNNVPYQISINNTPEDTLKRIPIEGQIVKIITNRGFTPSDIFEIKLTNPSFSEINKEELSGIRVVPNPYVVNAAWETAKNVRQIQFMYLPPICTISVYTTRGELVRKLEHTDGSGRLSWNLTSQSNQDLAFGVYIYVVKTPDGKEYVGKFALIK
ncbi:MAG: hypothetical protein GXO77_11970 [Calditrichaeota bacterium]|nr:hypothetical protein [Calditrichota bacterium]